MKIMHEIRKELSLEDYLTALIIRDKINTLRLDEDDFERVPKEYRKLFEKIDVTTDFDID